MAMPCGTKKLQIQFCCELWIKRKAGLNAKKVVKLVARPCRYRPTQFCVLQMAKINKPCLYYSSGAGIKFNIPRNFQLERLDAWLSGKNRFI